MRTKRGAAGIKREKQPEVSTIPWQEGKEKHNENEQWG